MYSLADFLQAIIVDGNVREECLIKGLMNTNENVTSLAFSRD